MSNCMVDLNQLFDYVNHAQSNGDRVRGQVSNMRGCLNRIVSSNAMRGRTKEQINRLITTQQIPLLQGLENVYWKMFVKSNQAVNEFMSAMSESEEGAIFNRDSLLDLECDIAQANDEVLDLNSEYQRIYCSMAGDISLPMPSSGEYESNYEQARTSLRNTRECLEGFRFDYGEIRELMVEIERYVGLLEAASDLPIHSVDRGNLFGGSDFAQRMGDIHAEFAAVEQAKIDTMVASWEGMHYSDIIGSLPEPMTQAEFNALMGFVDGMCEEFQAGFFSEGLEISYSSSGFLSGVGTFFGGLLEKTLGGVVDHSADIAWDTSLRNVHFGRSIAARLGRDSTGSFVSFRNPLDRRVRITFRDMSNAASRRVGNLVRGAGIGLQIWGAVSYFRDHYKKYRNVGRATSFTGYMIGTSSTIKASLGGTTLTRLGSSLTTRFGNSGKLGRAGQALSRTGGRLTRVENKLKAKKPYKLYKGATKYLTSKITAGITKAGTAKVGKVAVGKGLVKVGAVALGIKAAPILAAAAVGVGIGMGAKWLYRNFAPVGNTVRAIGDGLNAVGNGLRNVGRALNPFRRRNA